jgi:Tfp pilus assembly protein PilN
MKEIDLLPEWYKDDRKRQFSYRTQCVALGGMLLVLMVWNFVTAHSVATATAELARLESRAVGTENSSREFNRLKDEAAEFQRRTNVLKEIDSRVNVPNVLAELSFLIDRKVVLSKVNFKAEKFAHQKTAAPKNLTAVRVAGGNFGGKKSLLLGDVRFKIVMSGVASDAGEVADLICKLEDSPYFCQVVPSFSRNKKVKTGTPSGAKDYQVSEFEISCYLANYRQERHADEKGKLPAENRMSARDGAEAK